MKTLHCVRSAGIAALLCCLLLPAATGMAQGRPLLLAVELRGLNAIVRDGDSVVQGLGLGLPPGQLGTLLAEALPDIDLDTIDGEGTIRLYVFAKDATKTAAPGAPVVLIVPTPDGGEALAAALDAGGEVIGREDGIARIRQPPAGPRVPQDRYVATHGDHVFIGEDRDLVNQLRQGAASGALDLSGALQVPGTLAISLNASQAAEELQRVVDGVATMMPRTTRAGQPGMDPGAILKAEAGILKMLADQVETLQLGIGTDANGIVISSRTQARAGSVVGRVFSQSRPPREPFMRLLPEKQSIVQVGHIGAVDDFLGLYKDIVQTLYGAMGEQGESLSQFVGQALDDMRGITTGDYAVGCHFGVAPSRMTYVYYLGVTDAQRALAVFDRWAAAYGGTNQSLAGMSMKVDRGPAREYGGVAVRGYRVETSIDSEMLPGVNMGAMSFWTNIAYEVAAVDNIAVFAMGSVSEMNTALDRLRNPGTSLLARPTVAKALAGATGLANAVQVGAFSVSDYLRFVIGMMPGGDAMAAMLPPGDGGGLVGYSRTRGNTQLNVINLPYTELTGFKALTALGAMGQAPGATGAGPAMRP